MTPPALLKLLRIQGYRPFGDFIAQLGPLEVLVGANGSGKSSLFEFLKFLREGVRGDIPPEIVPGSIGQRVFHSPGPERFSWSVEVDFAGRFPVRYEGELMGPVGHWQVTRESARIVHPEEENPAVDLMEARGPVGWIRDPETKPEREDVLKRWSQLMPGVATSSFTTLYNLAESIRGWQFYSGLDIATDKIRRTAPTEQEPVLQEDARNLSPVLHFLYTEYQSVFDELQQLLRLVVPGFKSLRVKAYGGPGEVIAFWREEGVDTELNLADLSDGILRLICWMVLCLQPNPPSLICIDEPDQGVHPRTLPILAGLFQRASERTQILLATHSSYFLTQFDLSQIAVLRKENGEAKFLKPQDSKVLTENLKDFGPEEIEVMHRSDELEHLA